MREDWRWGRGNYALPVPKTKRMLTWPVGRGIVNKKFLDVRRVRLIVSVYQSSISEHALKLGCRRF